MLQYVHIPGLPESEHKPHVIRKGPIPQPTLTFVQLVAAWEALFYNDHYCVHSYDLKLGTNIFFQQFNKYSGYDVDNIFICQCKY